MSTADLNLITNYMRKHPGATVTATIQGVGVRLCRIWINARESLVPIVTFGEVKLGDLDITDDDIFAVYSTQLAPLGYFEIGDVIQFRAVPRPRPDRSLQLRELTHIRRVRPQHPKNRKPVPLNGEVRLGMMLTRCHAYDNLSTANWHRFNCEYYIEGYEVWKRNLLRIHQAPRHVQAPWQMSIPVNTGSHNKHDGRLPYLMKNYLAGHQAKASNHGNPFRKKGK